MLGITDVRFFGYDDAVLTLREELILRMASLIREIRPDVIVTHHPNELGEYGNHHAMTAQLVLNGIGAAHGVGMGDPNPPHRVAQVFFTLHRADHAVEYAGRASSPWYPDLVVDITDVVEAKVRGPGHHAQPAVRRELRAQDDRDGRRRDGVGRWRGLRRGVRHLSCPTSAGLFPVSDWQLQRATESEADLMHRRSQIIAATVDLPD